MKLRLLILSLIAFTSAGCADAYKRSIGRDTDQTYSRIFLTDFNTAWQASLEALKAIPIGEQNREAGTILTKWTENTAQKNFVEVYGNQDAFLKAQYRVKVSLAKGTYNGVPSVKVVLQKEQLIQRDVLEGWRPVETDALEENTLLYRIGRIIYIKVKLAKLEEERIKKSLNETPSF